MTQELSIRLPGGIWKRIRDLRKQVNEMSATLSVELREALVMATTELVENAVKYGENAPLFEDIAVHVTLEPTSLTVEVCNGVVERQPLQELFERIDEIRESVDREALYTRRLTEILSDPTRPGKLGLYRVAFEGGFDLDCVLDGQKLCVRAKRELVLPWQPFISKTTDSPSRSIASPARPSSAGAA
ncbi:MAG: hypothetical protein MUF64_22120 [Polyangiaceae bacterium]|jgi:hypothetical protein|nr:hypothetical protein [Polyangiaceae bacterium]